MKPGRKPLSKRLGSALVMTLVIIVLITVVTVGYLASVMLETKTAGASLDQERAYGIAMIGAHQAMSRIRDALGPWDDPYKNFATNPPNFYWSLSPGRITRWAYTSLSPQTNFALFSESAGTNLVNLNRQLADGTYPIIGGTNPPNVSVKWVNVWRAPSQPASATNPIVGRYAFWVDDEGAKVNVNTADGTEKYTTNSLGIGTPSEVSLEVLFGGTNGRALSKQVVQMARTNGFVSPREILRAPGMATNAFTENVFSLTAYSRSPELNVFGQPRVALSPILGQGGPNVGGNMVLNSLTLLPAREIYPTPSQLPPYTVSSAYLPNPNTPRNLLWPLSLRAEMGAFSVGTPYDDYRNIMNATALPNYAYHQGYLLAKYLAGTNAAGQPVNWPVFTQSSTQGFAGKYTPRQLDSLVVQILTIGSKAISADYPYSSGDVGEQIGHRFMIAPYLFPGWLSGQWVIGVGRAMKLTQMYLEVETFPSVGNWDTDPSTYSPPKAILDFWLEWWLPASYFGGPTVLTPQESYVFLGHRQAKAILNPIDMPGDFDVEFIAPIPHDPTVPNPGSPYWGNQVLRNDGGIDFAGNPSDDGSGTALDHDQAMAEQFHDPFARTNSSMPGPWKGTAPYPTAVSSGTFHNYQSPFMMQYLEPNKTPVKEWEPGEMRAIGSQVRYQVSMRTNATSLSIAGGVAVKTQFKDGYFSDPDPVPLEAVRGPYIRAGLCTQEPFTQRNDSELPFLWTNTLAVPGQPSKGNLRKRVAESVIPVNLNIPGLGQPGHVVATVDDPLVNKFPGDWKISTSASTTIQTNPDRTILHSYPDTSFRGTLADPDCYWMPRADAALCSSIGDVANQTLIPRSARMPNIGYLQYMRTGIIPDDESLPYEYDPGQPNREIQHGTPFRLLSFAPSYEDRDATDPLVGQQTTRSGSQPYPDWALLDLLYIPSTLAPFGGTYNPAVANPTTNSAVTNLLYYGTFGGATAGKINPNGTVIYTTNAQVAQTNVSRTLPIQAVLNGVMVNQTLTGTGTNAQFTNGALVPADSIARAIENFVRTNGPLKMPAEICNVPEIAALRATNNLTRNDLVRQIVGALTTQDNVFSVWTVGQAIQKKPSNPQYGEFEAGDNILAEVRLHFVVERYLDPGADGIYGNNGDDGPDNVVGTYDDPMEANNHPFEPRYLYRVVASEEIR
jgi:hypothetical protein